MNMLRFEDPIYLWLLLLIPLLVLLWLLMVRLQRRRLRKFGDYALVKSLMPDVSRYRPAVKFVLLLAVLAVLILMVARPQMGTKVSQEKRNGIEAIICLDISNSMRAEDVVPSRLDKSKMLVENMVDHFTNDKIGLVVFAGDAFVQLPITSDYVSAKMFLQNIDPSLIATQGTDIARAIGKSRQYVTLATALIDPPDWLLAAYRDGRCRGLAELYDLRKLAGQHPQYVEAWASDRDARRGPSSTCLRGRSRRAMCLHRSPPCRCL